MRGCRLFVLALALLVVVPAMATEGRTPVFLDGTVIATDGRYILTRDIVSGGAGIPVIDIAASSVDLDLNGFTIFGTAAGPGILISVPSPVNVRIHNGSVVGAALAIDHPVSPPGPPGTTVVVEDLRVSSTGLDGIHLPGVENIVIRRCSFIDIGGIAIRLTSPGGNFGHGEVSHNSIKRTGADGIVIERKAAMEVSHNHIEVAGSGFIGTGIGIVVVDSVGNLIGENVISDPSEHGIYLSGPSKGNKVYNNVIRHAFVIGIFVDIPATENLLLDNVVTDCGFDVGGAPGLLMDGSLNHIEGNTFNANAGCGMEFTPGSFSNVFGRNMARGNGGVPGACPVAASCVPLFTPDSCDGTLGAGGNDSNLENMIPFLF